MAVELQNILDNINTISTNINTNVFIKNARDAVKEGINAYAVEEDEKAKIYASFEQQLSATVISQIMLMAKEMPMMIAQEEAIRKDIDLKAQQKTLVEKQITTEQKKALDLEKATELRQQQINTEKRRQDDIAATINIKNQDAVYKYQQAKFEESRRYLGIKANVDNMQIRKAMARVEEMNAFMTNDSYDVTSEQFNASKTTIDAISTTQLTYTSEVITAPTTITVTPLT